MAKVIVSKITEEMKKAYLDYAMSVIVSRALPDVKDGLKPVHRRILYAMYKMGITFGGRFSKSAKIVGEVLGKYHPHGDSSVYEALVRMAQEFSMRYPLIRGQGNFGSIDGDPPAAMRYTETKLNRIAEEMLHDIEKETVDFVDNFDTTLKEPVYLPAKLPNLLLMGAEGIAVGMATKIPPHNLIEVVDALCYMIDKAKLPEDVKTKDVSQRNLLGFDINIDEILQFIKGPDFPTGALMYGFNEIKQAYVTGKASILVRAKVDSEQITKNKTAIIITELPYQINKANLVKKIAKLVIDKKILGISDLRDESDREGIRVVIELKRDASYKKVLNNLFKYTEIQTTFPVNFVALVDGVPQTLSLKAALTLYLRHRVNVVTKRCQFELKKAKERAHILEGYLIALDNIDAVIQIIKKSASEGEAKLKLMEKFKLSSLQSQAILDMQLKRLTGLERSKIEDELAKLEKTINHLESLLRDVFKILSVIKEELTYLKKKYGDPRRTKVFKYRPGQISDEELYENKETIVVMTKEGYIKRVPRETFKVQHRGGKGVIGIQRKDNDNVYKIFSTMTHNYTLFFTNLGRVFKTRVWEIPKGSRTSKGKAIVNLLALRPNEKVTSILAFNESDVNKKEGAESRDVNSDYIFMATKKGVVKKTLFKNFANIRSNGIIAIKLDKDDELLWAKITNGNFNILLATRLGKAIIFKETEIRSTGRSSRGVRGIRLNTDDRLCAFDAFEDKDFKKYIFVIGKKGIGKKTSLKLFRDQHRGGKGVKVVSVDKKFGEIASLKIINKKGETVVITSESGQVVKIPVASIPSRSRSAKGVILMRFSGENDRVASTAFI